MNKVWIQVNDPHIASQAPRGRTDSYESDVLAKLAWVMEYANEVEAAGIVVTGDLLNRKNPTHTSHLLVQKIRAVFALADAPIHLIVGNHDRNNGGQIDGQPILGVVDGTHVHLLDGPSGIDGYIAGIPWSDSFEREGGAALLAERIADTRCPLVFCHAPISDRMYPFGPEERGWLLAGDVAGHILARSAITRLVAHGHFHGRQEVAAYPLGSQAVTFSNPGALSRATVAVDDVERVPAIAVIEYGIGDDHPLTVRYEDVPCRPAAEVLRVEEHLADTDREDAVQSLARSLTRAFAETVDADSLRAMLKTLGCPEQFDREVWDRGLALAEAALDGEVLV